jgi:hypothetical protein
MLDRYRQRGIGWFGLLLLFGAIGFGALLTFEVLPVYLNQMKIARAVNAVAADSPSSVTEVRSALQRYWDIESIDELTPRDVKVVRASNGRRLVYAYEARRHLFANVSLVLEFEGDVPMSGNNP